MPVLVEKRPEVSIVVPAYNAEDTIDACVQSLLQLSYAGEVEVIVVDNASTDQTALRLDPYRDRITVLYEARRGRSFARNRGTRHARGRVIAMTDADCVVDADWLTHLLPPLDRPDTGLVGGTIRALTPDNPIARFGERIHDHRAAIETYRPPYVITINVAARRDLLLDVGLFDEALVRGGDVDLAWRVVQAGYAVRFAERAVVHHRNHRTLRGLFGEGFAHGYHAPRVRCKHAAFLQAYGASASPRSALRARLRHLAALLARRHDPWWLYEVVFNTGKLLGEMLGPLALPPADARPTS